MTLAYSQLENAEWTGFLIGLSVDTVIILFAIANIVLTIYALWYVSSLAAYMESNELRKCYGTKRTGSSSRLKLGIVIPFYNDYEVLSSIERLLKTVSEDDVVVLVDDSTDKALVEEVDRLVSERKNFIHLKRGSRRGLKAGALNDAIRLLEGYGVDYVLVLDADFEIPSPGMLERYRECLETYRPDLLQGYQRHVKGSDSLLGLLYRASQAGAVIFLYGRQVMRMFPFFTGSCGVIRYGLLKEVGFKEGSLSEDLRWTIDLYHRVGEPRILVSDLLYADGSVPRSYKALFRQQIRWSSGTLVEFKETLLETILSKQISTWDKLGFILQGLFYTQGLWILVASLAPFILYLATGIELSMLFPLGVYTWLIGMETLLVAGGLREGYSGGHLAVLVAASLAYVYLMALIHTIGTFKGLLGRASWIVTSKRGRYEHLYSE
ncbi:glycosyltransferase [Thermogladius sp. 4427co]|uniref:glycosyltransferase n=1 Tax=Thermogladius sp. 4427co TaxID=3450718 RepID=UPI003F7ABDAF